MAEVSSHRPSFRPQVTRLEQRVVPAIVPIGTEFQVNDPIIPDVAAPAVALGGTGMFVVAWHAFDFDGADLGVLARRYDVNGVPTGAPFVVNSFTAGAQQRPSVAADAAGNFIIVWSSASAQDGSRDGIFARRYNAAGNPITGEIQINQFTLNIQGAPSVAMDHDGDFVVAWESNYQDGDGYGIYARRYDAAGVPMTNEFPVNEITTGDQTSPRVALSSTGDFVVTWQGPDDDGLGVFARRFQGNGTPAGPDFPVNSYSTGSQFTPQIAGNTAGDFAIVWQSQSQDDNTSGIYLRRYSAAGTPTGPEVRVNTYTTGEQTAPSITSNAAGELTVTWQSDGQDGDGAGIYGQRYSAAGPTIDSEFRVATSYLGEQMTPAVGADAYGNFVVAWIGAIAPVEGVMAQRYAKPPVPSATLTINEGQVQRSAILSFTLTFNTLMNIAPGGVTLTGPAGDVTLIPDFSASTTPQTTVRYTFAGNGVTPGGLVDGHYTITINSALVTNYDNEGYDGDGNGLPGPDAVFTFHRLFGDADGNRVVEPIDILAFRIAFLSSEGSGSWNYAFDYDGNGTVDPNDFLQFRLRFLRSI